MIKRKIFWWFLMLLLLVGLIWLAGNNQGYVLIVRSPYRVQISFNFLLVLFVLGALGLHYCLRLMHFLQHLPLYKHRKEESIKLRAGNAALLEGMHALAEGDLEKAENAAKLARQLIQNSDLDKLIQAIAAGKNKQELLLK